eukprot:TRINITY_DN8452_c0_g1_i2.p1 TRINITY_DN8452_c0_g1~~TRINITY_DN8452_c0_g1_i2.p1  ORF type:complete len:256 (+),score=65.16 TRINITY_DN8452_c0_g1_i2:150-917(+)
MKAVFMGHRLNGFCSIKPSTNKQKLVLIPASKSVTTFHKHAQTNNKLHAASHWQLLVLALPTFMYLSVEFLMLGYWYECLHVSLRRDSVLDTFLIWLSEGVRPVYVVVGMTVVGYATIMPNFLWCLLQGCNEYLPIITYVYVNSIYFLLAAAFVVMSYRLVVLSGSKEFSLIGTLAHFVMWVTAIGLFFRGVIGMLEFSPAYRAWADPIEWIQVGYYGVLEFLQVVAVLLGLHAIKSTLRQMHFSRLNDDASDSE